METYDYIVVGSGIAGLHTAYRLQQRGKKVLVLEKESYIGGRMSSHLIDGIFFDFGAKFVLNVYKYMMPLAKELGIEPVSINLTKAAIRKEGTLHYFDGAEGIRSVLSYKGISFRAKLRLALAMVRIWLKYRKLDVWKLEDTLYLDTKSIYEDFRKQTGSEAFDHVIESFSRNVVFYSTKDMSQAAFYALFSKLIKAKSLNFPEGVGQLCEKMAAHVPVERGVTVQSVTRTHDGVIVEAQKDEQHMIYRANKVVIAVPGNRVLDILKDPLPHEKAFFSQIQYASTVQVLCEGKTDIFDDANIIWTLPHEESNFTALGGRDGRAPSYSSSGALYFIAALREATFWRLRESNTLNAETIKELIEKEFPNIHDIKVILIQVWESATPKVYPGYITKTIEFLRKTTKDDAVYFCGDYLENPSTEGALTSSVKLLERLQ